MNCNIFIMKNKENVDIYNRVNISMEAAKNSKLL